MGLINYFIVFRSQLLNPKPQPVIQSIKRLGFSQSNKNLSKILEIDRFGISGADTDIFRILKSCFLLHYQKYYVFYALPFSQKLQKSGFVS